MSTTITPEDILRKAADLVERPGGWCQGDWTTGKALCLTGAIMAASLGVERLPLHAFIRFGSARRMKTAHQAVATEIGQWTLAAWNDAPGRTAIEVATALRNAKRWL
jgi:hypothetical protein